MEWVQEVFDLRLGSSMESKVINLWQQRMRDVLVQNKVWKVLVRDRPESIWRIGKNSKTLPSHSHVSLGSNRNDGEGVLSSRESKTREVGVQVERRSLRRSSDDK